MVTKRTLLSTEELTFLVEWTFPHTNTYFVLFNLEKETKRNMFYIVAEQGLQRTIILLALDLMIIYLMICLM